MIGFYGIIANEDVLDSQKRHDAFSKMSNDIARDDFYKQTIFGKHFSIGITARSIGGNKDLALQTIEKDFISELFDYFQMLYLFNKEKRNIFCSIYFSEFYLFNSFLDVQILRNKFLSGRCEFLKEKSRLLP